MTTHAVDLRAVRAAEDDVFLFGANQEGFENGSYRVYSRKVRVDGIAFSGDGTVQGTCFGLVSKYLDDAGSPTFQNGCLPGTTGGGGSSGSVIGGSFRLAQ